MGAAATASWLLLLSWARAARGEVAPEITAVEEGYNIVAKVPCEGCPFLWQDVSKGLDGPWEEREDGNALLLNISLPYDSAFLSINNAPLLSDSSILPRIYANQVVLDISASDLSTAIESNQLEANHEEGSSVGGGYFGLSYSYSLRPIRTSIESSYSADGSTNRPLNALLFQFDVLELHSDLPEHPMSHKLQSPDQKKLELILLEKPVLSPLQPAAAYEIINASLTPRSHNPPPPSSPLTRTMKFPEWDAFGKKGTASHAASRMGASFLDYISSGVWALFMFCLSIIALFVVVCLFCIFGCGWCEDEYASAQHGKKRRGGSGGGGGGWGDVEKGKGKGRFLSPEELGIVGRGRIVGVGKSD
ncbi:hypothetical protein BS50DRAFT_635044 [Corynespora cassiicola Philippines]|uniref:Uncharacterized protein n=1 Tax=Corynespora cassiicola Philippines TaxID=1448308 RepID=A0A2T2NK68_CORCC|nr:hypothetical protein BS50DRAFT_635044 [Corynespora cassiicola Philippines]